MLGSSITVSYYFNLTLPLCFYMYSTASDKKWHIISGSAIILNVIATFLLLSRLAAICTILIIVVYLFIVDEHNYHYGKKIAIIASVMITFFIADEYYDFSRIQSGINLSANSEQSRLTASRLGMSIFADYPLFGSGMGRYYERVYRYKNISYNEMSSIIDPHNMYVLILSEMGIVGMIITGILLASLFLCFSQLREKNLKRCAYITLGTFMIGALGGSQMINEISFSSVLWIYLGLFRSVSIQDPKPRYETSHKKNLNERQTGPK
jgi:O-antigen ligase